VVFSLPNEKSEQHIQTYCEMCTHCYATLGKHIPTRGNNRTSIARQLPSRHASLTREAVFSVWSVQIDYMEVFSKKEQYTHVEGESNTSTVIL
jgi:hypothetical protein